MSTTNEFPWVGDQEDESVRPSPISPTFEEVLERRSFLMGLATLPLGMSVAVAADNSQGAFAWNDGLSFNPISLTPAGGQDFINVADGYDVSLIAAWGHPVNPGAPAFNLEAQTPEAQAQQFGYNCDYVGYFGLPNPASRDSNRGLLAVNHEYTNPELMFRNYQAGNPTRAQVDIEIAAHGLSIIEIARQPRAWEMVAGSRFNRRYTGETPMELTGPAAGDESLRTSQDPTGRRVRGTLNNCSGGNTPWGTVLTAEENFNQYFGNVNAMPDGPLKASHQRYGLTPGLSARRWEQFHDRFDVVKEPNEANRFGWVVEIDPYDPTFVPKKRTAMGRQKHECATVVVAPDNRVAVYSGDDERFEYVYKFVSNGRFDPNNRAANLNLLDDGVLYVARYNDDGTGEWLPLVFGQGRLTPANGFRNQADVLVRCRFAADAVGATRMDRPEDVEANPISGKVYLVCTNNSNRTAAQVDRANPRANNRNGHIIEMIEAGNDHTATRFRWEMFMLCGMPDAADTFFAGFDKTRVSPIGAPDQIVFDVRGNMWIGTDGMEAALRFNDTVYACPTEGPNRGRLQPFLSVPNGAEVCGPELTPDSTTMFVAIQHPGEGGTLGGQVVSNWPFGNQPPRPGVIAVVKKLGTGNPVIGS